MISKKFKLVIVTLSFFVGTNSCFICAGKTNANIKLQDFSKDMAICELLARATTELSCAQAIRHHFYGIRLSDGSNNASRFIQKFKYSSNMLNETINNAEEIENSFIIEMLKIILQTIKAHRKHGGNFFGQNYPQRKALYKFTEFVIKKVLYKPIKNNIDNRIPRRIIRVFIFSLLAALSKSFVYQDYNYFTDKFVKSLIKNAIFEGLGEILIKEIEAIK